MNTTGGFPAPTFLYVYNTFQTSIYDSKGDIQHFVYFGTWLPGGHF